VRNPADEGIAAARQENAVRAIAEELGYEVEETGGGCTALVRYAYQRSAFVTDGEASAPSDPLASCYVGLFDEAGDVLHEETRPSLREALERGINLLSAWQVAE
jgi:hypothetical protein